LLLPFLVKTYYISFIISENTYPVKVFFWFSLFYTWGGAIYGINKTNIKQKSIKILHIPQKEPMDFMCPPTPAPKNGMTRHGGYIIGLSTDKLCSNLLCIPPP